MNSLNIKIVTNDQTAVDRYVLHRHYQHKVTARCFPEDSGDLGTYDCVIFYDLTMEKYIELGIESMIKKCQKTQFMIVTGSPINEFATHKNLEIESISDSRLDHVCCIIISHSRTFPESIDPNYYDNMPGLLDSYPRRSKPVRKPIRIR